ncbi:MAG: LysM peptidoglycan-binding domain-containing protein [Actinobacteria bacterium]|nr:LysM peptidoglycan-binding domain-containing protein [Actinomycetota bacterium]
MAFVPVSAMSTYQQSSLPGPERAPALGRRRPQGGDGIPPTPRDPFWRRLGLIVLVGGLVAPIAWALRGDGDAVSVQETGGAAAIVQMDTTDDTIDPAASTSEVTPQSVPSAPVVGNAPSTTPAPTTVAPSRLCPQKYMVQPGDSWFRIAERAGVSPGLIAGSNGATLKSRLTPGQEICLPPGAVVPPSTEPAREPAEVSTQSAPSCGLSYVVQRGDSWFGIAKRAGVKAGPLAAVNGRTIQSPLKIGQTICLPEGAKRPATTAAPTTAPASAPATNNSSSRATSSNDMRQVPYNPTQSYSRDEVAQIIRDVWPDNLENDALFVAQRESKFNPGSRSACCIGVFQINWSAHKRWLANQGITDPAQLFDPVTNARMALITWERSGSWKPWCTRSWCPVG